jgi:hypothetical protein
LESLIALAYRINILEKHSPREVTRPTSKEKFPDKVQALPQVRDHRALSLKRKYKLKMVLIINVALLAVIGRVQTLPLGFHRRSQTQR